MNITVKAGLGAVIVVGGLIVGLSRVTAAGTPPAATPPGSTIDQRIAQRKQERAVVLADADTQRLIQSCVDAQGKIRVLQTNTVPILANRTKVYQRIDAKLWVVIGELKLANKDTFVLEKERLGLADKTAAFQATANSYTQTLDDIQNINCKADTVGFEALIETARLYYTQLQSQSADSRGYIVDTIKLQLSNYITDLQSKTPTDGSN